MPDFSKPSAAKGQQKRTSGPIAAITFAGYPKPIRTKLLALRKLILDTAKATDGVGALEEALKWGQVSFLTRESKSGSTIRIDRVKSEPDRYALYVHCQTNLVETFRELYPELTYGGDRCILLNVNDEMPKDALRHCVGLALTYHRHKNRHDQPRGSSQSAGRRAPTKASVS